jgi:hypothetical protein
MRALILIAFGLLLTSIKAQGPYASPAGEPGSLAIHKDSSVFIGWASNAIINRGWQNITNTSAGQTTAGDSISPTGKSGLNGVVSLGDGGIATLTFDGIIYDGPGADFAVFENSFDGLFLELAFVEVSSDGFSFFRFDAVSLTDTSAQIASFGNTDATNIYNLAGKYKAQYGTPFDLNQLAGKPGLDINNITHIRIIDVVGNIDELYTTYDSQNNPINDPWPTEFPVGGFDLDAVGVINFIPTSVDELNSEIQLNLYPNPAKELLNFNFKEIDDYIIDIVDLTGKTLLSDQTNSTTHQLSLNSLSPGIYFVSIKSESKSVVKRIVKQ